MTDTVSISCGLVATLDFVDLFPTGANTSFCANRWLFDYRNRVRPIPRKTVIALAQHLQGRFHALFFQYAENRGEPHE